MKYQLPQFIETEVKLVGPFTLRQFLWVAGGASILFLLFVVLRPGVLFFILAIPVIGCSLSLAFVKIQGMPLINYLSYILAYSLNPKKYVYRFDEGSTITVPKRS